MFDVVLVTHGRLGEALLDTAAMVYGDAGEDVSALGLVPGESPDELLAAVEERIRAARGGCLVLCDILGGSPFLMAARAYRELSGTCSVRVVSGLNLGMLLEVLAARDDASLEEGARAALAGARRSICDLSERLGQEAS